MKRVASIISFAKKHKIISAVVVIALVIAVLIFRPKPAPLLETQAAKLGNIAQTVSITGNVASQNLTNLSFQSGGKLVYLAGKVGDSVFQGEVIASLDKTKLTANLRQYQQDFNAGRAVVAQVYDQTGRVPNLTFAQNVTQTAAEATQNKAYDNIKIVEQQLRDLDLVSPITGTIIRGDVTVPGVNVTASTVFAVADDKTLLFQMDVDEADISKVQVGQEVRITLDSYPDKTISLHVSSIDFSSHTTSTGGNAYTVKTEPLDNSTGLYRIGLNGGADIVISEKLNTLTIPSSAIFDNDKVYVKNPSTVIKKTVKIGLQNNTDSEIVSGLSQGDLVILQPSLYQKSNK